MKKNICFIGNFYKTEVLLAIAKVLEQNNIEVYWILPKKSQYNYLSQAVGTQKLLLIDRTLINKKSPAIGDFKLNELIYGDRVWRHEMQQGLDYLTNLQKPVADFIKANNIRFVFGEDTWAHELLIHRMCNQIKKLNCVYYSQMVVRIPNGYFFYFHDEKQVHAVRKPKIQVQANHEVRELKVEKPEYLATNNKFIKDAISAKGLLRRLKRFISNENIEPTDPNVITNQWTRLKVAGREVLNQKTYFFLKRQKQEEVMDKKFILFGFHKQPEASIDVCGRYFEDQFMNVINLWRQLPPDWYLVIKEHSNAIGNRSYSFFKKLLRYPRIILLNEYSDSHILIKKAQLVATNTGTMALEAALMGTPAITFSKVVFNNLNLCRRMTWQDFEKYDSLEDLVKEMKFLPDNKEDYQDFVNANSFEGVLVDTVSMPSVLNDDNITKLANSFLTILQEL